MTNKILGWVILTAYERPNRWEMDEKELFRSKNEARDFYNREYRCLECNSKPFSKHVKAGYIKCVRIQEVPSGK